jgi:arylsulfatase A-like enzyme
MNVRNVVMIVADTFRSDYLGAHGGDVDTPNLDALAARSIDFRRHHIGSFPTVPTRADYFTGQYSFANQIGWGGLPADLENVPQLLQYAGVTTAGVVDTPFFRIKGYNWDRGFDFFYDLELQQVGQLTTDPRHRNPSKLVPEPWITEFDHAAPQTMTLAEKCVEQLVDRDRFFLYVDTWDPHEPWDAPTWYGKRYKADFQGRNIKPAYGNYLEHGLTDDDLAEATAAYKGKMTMVDRWIGRLLDRIESMGLLDDTAIVFTTDHGFNFGERGGQFGKMVAGPAEDGERRWLRSPLHKEIVEIPLLISIPGEAPRSENRLSGAIDIAPTVADLFGIEKQAWMHGRSLLDYVRSDDAPADDVIVSAMPLGVPGRASVSVVDDVTRSVIEWQPITVASGRWVMLFATQDDPIELYDVEADPDWHSNVVDDHPDTARDLHAKMMAELRTAGADDEQLEARGWTA